MKLKRVKYISSDQADALIEKYYDGFTTVEEEKQLKDFLSQNKLADKYKPEQAIFGYFNSKKKASTFSLKPYLRWAGAAAAVLVIAIGVQTFNQENLSSYAYIDGVKITNKNEIKNQALTSLSNISADNNEVRKCFDNLNDKEIMQQQLDVFSALGE